MKNLVNLFDQLNWENADNYPEGTLMKTFRDENAAKTILLKFPPGFQMPPHSHLTTEQHFILQGTYTIDGNKYFTGAYQIFHAHEEHGPFHSEHGALVLVIWNA